MIHFKSFLAIGLLILPLLTAALPYQREQFTDRDLEDIFSREFLEQASLEERGSISDALKKAWKKVKGSAEVKHVVADTLHSLAKSLNRKGGTNSFRHTRELEEEELDLRDDMLYQRIGKGWKS